MTQVSEQMPLMDAYGVEGLPSFRDAGAGDNKVLPVHRWVPWIAGFSAQFVEDAVDAYLPKSRRGDCLVLDPFAGVGTTLVEGLKAGCNVVGFEINAYAAMAARAKLRCLDLSVITTRASIETFSQNLRTAETQVDRVWAESGEAGLLSVLETLRLGRPLSFRSRIPLFSLPVEAKVLFALNHVEQLEPGIQDFVKVALGATMISFSNYSYEPSLGSRPGAGKALIENASVADALAKKLAEMLADIEWARLAFSDSTWLRRRDVIQGSYFDASIPGGAVNLVITSPPYMNNYHYVRNTRPQLYWLGLVSDLAQLKAYETASFGKFWQTVRQGPIIEVVPDIALVRDKVAQLRTLRTEKGAYGGPGWANYVATYVNDCSKLVKQMSAELAEDGRAVIVVGNSIIQGMEFKIDEILAELGEMNGLQTESIVMVRKKRVGNSIIASSVRKAAPESQQAVLYDAAVVLKKPA